MQQPDLFLLFTTRLDSIGLKHMVTGSVATILYGQPRLTHDIDIILELGQQDIEPLIGVFPLSEFYCPPEEVLEIERSRRQHGHFNLIHHASGYKADIYLTGNDPLHAWAMSRRKRIALPESGHLWIAPVEYVIVRKLQFHHEGGSEKHLTDIKGVLDVSGDEIDSSAVSERADRLGVRAEWDSISADE